MKTGEDCAIFPCPDVSPGGFEPPTFRLGGEPSIQLRYEDILDFPLFSRLCRASALYPTEPTELQKPVLHIIKALRGKHKQNRPFEASELHAFASTWSIA